MPDHTETRRTLSDLQGIDPMIVVVLSRGHYCPKDRLQTAHAIEGALSIGSGVTFSQKGDPAGGREIFHGRDICAFCHGEYWGQG